MLGSFEHPDQETLMHLLDASLRALPATSESHHAQRAQKAYLKTLTLLSPHLFNASQAIFEMPLCYWPNASTLIEGFADLVIESHDFIGVIEFKSSRRLATHENTYLQIFAYAEALAAYSPKPIKYTVMLVGSTKEFRWRLYDQRCKDALGVAIDAMINAQ